MIAVYTLRIGCTELKAVPHASLGYHFLRVQVRATEAWGSSKGKESKVVSRDRDDRLTTVAHNCGVRDGSLKNLTQVRRRASPPISVFNASLFVGLVLV